MTKLQLKQARRIARQMIADGCDPQGLSHILWYPQDHYLNNTEILGVSYPLPAGSDLAGYIERYRTLEEWASE